MIKRGKTKDSLSKIPTGIGIGVAVSLILTIVGAAIAAYLTESEIIGENSIGIAVGVILTVNAAFGSLLAIACIKQKRMLVCLLTGFCYLLCLLAITALFFSGQYSGVGMSSIYILCGSGCVAVTGLLSGKKQNSHRKKYPYR